MKPSTIIVVILLLLVSLGHLLRFIFQWEVMVNNIEIPMWLSAVACVVTALLAAWLWQQNKK